MPDTPVSSLDARQQKMLDHARRAFEQDNFAYVGTACAQILQAVPGCLSVRKLQRAAALRVRQKTGPLRRMFARLKSLPFAVGGSMDSPQAALAKAEKTLAENPANIPALQMLAEAARALDWPETRAFALEAVCALEPDQRTHQLALGVAWLAAGKPDTALKIADRVLRKSPVDGDAQTLMRQASIARTITQGQWEGEGNYREKLKVETSSSETAKVMASPVNPPPDEKTAPLDSIESARDFVGRYPGDLDARFRLAELALAAGEVDLAIAQYQQAQKNPKLALRASLGLARCFRRRGLDDLAITQLQAAKQSLVVMDELKKDVVYELASCYEASGQSDLAMAEFKEIYVEDIGFRDVAAKINSHYQRPKSSE